MTRPRLDSLLVERGLYDSRARAAAAVMAGEVRVGDRGRRAAKPGERVAPDVLVDVERALPYASRGGLKLAYALDALGVEVAGRRCLDVGASTGGFTDCLLQHGAAHVIAVDVGYGQLEWRLRRDARVSAIERTNARTLRAEALPYRPDLIVVDVSFISLTKVLPPVLGCADHRFDCLALVKPQFEVGRERVGKGGVVRSPDDRRAALMTVGRSVADAGYAVVGFQSSGLPGPKGNRESFVWVAPAAHAPATRDLEEAARSVER